MIIKLERLNSQQKTTFMGSLLKHLLKYTNLISIFPKKINTNHHHKPSWDLQQLNRTPGKLSCSLFLELLWPFYSSVYRGSLILPSWLTILRQQIWSYYTFLPPNRSTFCHCDISGSTVVTNKRNNFIDIWTIISQRTYYLTENGLF